MSHPKVPQFGVYDTAAALWVGPLLDIESVAQALAAKSDSYVVLHVSVMPKHPVPQPHGPQPAPSPAH